MVLKEDLGVLYQIIWGLFMKISIEHKKMWFNMRIHGVNIG